MKKKGIDQATIHKKTGVTVALWDVNLDVMRVKSLLLSAYLALVNPP